MKKTIYLLFTLLAFISCKPQLEPVATTSASNTSTVDSISTTIPFNPEVKTGTLENGLTYYIKNNGKPENKVELRLVVKAGSILEDDDQQGLAHFMEHMNFNGTKNFKKNELVDYLQSIGVKFGAHLNAYTSFDETVYILPIPSDDPEKLEKGFQIIEDWAHNALLTPEEIDKERGVVLEEYRLGQGADERMMQNYLPKVLYGSKYAERLPIGKKDILENFNYESLIRFYKDWYRPDLMAVMAVGDVDVALLEEKIKSHFGGIKNPEHPKTRASYYLTNHDETLIAIESDKEAPFTRVQVMFKDLDNASASITLEDYKKDVLESLFSQMINNRLDELRNSPNPPFVYGYSFHGGTWADTKEAYQSFAMTSETGQLNALKTLLEENERVRQFGFNPGEFERAKKDLLARMEQSFKDKDKTESKRIISEYVRHFLNNEPMPGITWEYNFYKNFLPEAKLEDVNALISDYIKETNRVIILTGPEKEGLEPVTKAQVTTLINAVKNTTLTPYEDKQLASSLISELPTAGGITKTETNATLGTTTLYLSNGAIVTYKKTDFKNDEILFDAFGFGGTSNLSTEDYLATSFAYNGLSEAGVNSFDKTTLDQMLSGKIVRVSPRISTYNTSISGMASPKAIEELFQLTHLYFTKLNKNKDAYASYTGKQKAMLGNILSNPNFYFQIEMGKFLSGKNPRFTGFPTPEKFDQMNYDLAYDKYTELFDNANGFHFYFVGNIDEDRIKSLSQTYLASLPAKEAPDTYQTFDFRPLTGGQENIIKKGVDPKSFVRIIYQGETTYTNKEHHALKSLGEILSIKLIEKLREEEGGVYGVGARGSITKFPYGWYNFSVNFPCGPENVDKLKAAALTEIETLVNNGPTDADLAKIKEAQKLEYKEDLKDNKFWLSTLKDADYLQKDTSRIFDFESDVDALTKADIKNVAVKYLSDAPIIGILYPED
ncbi:M16 family metallopeptidase [Neotamlana laminarinivorans]|uniref:Insulinase family protein n=1 Tax=Neotamlana laminarinivorans TaxID=2883124 RepID=A0A9X1HZF8_9FLAO|nr:insulinase family protein [Tamlana laminarinivorans]MCB4798983.1 insulinase family protein [Tamlana laminarinivorans]